MSQTAQAIAFNRNELITLPWEVLASQYPNGTIFDYQFQILDDDGAVILNVTDSVTVAGLAFNVELSTDDTGAPDEGTWPYTLWDTTNSRRMAFGDCYVGPAQV